MGDVGPVLEMNDRPRSGTSGHLARSLKRAICLIEQESWSSGAILTIGLAIGLFEPWFFGERGHDQGDDTQPDHWNGPQGGAEDKPADKNGDVRHILGIARVPIKPIGRELVLGATASLQSQLEHASPHDQVANED